MRRLYVLAQAHLHQTSITEIEGIAEKIDYSLPRVDSWKRTDLYTVRMQYGIHNYGCERHAHNAQLAVSRLLVGVEGQSTCPVQ